MPGPSSSQVLGLKRDDNVSARVKAEFKTTRHTLTASSSGDIAKLCEVFESIVNDPNRVALVELTPYTTVDGEPYVVVRTRHRKESVDASKGDKVKIQWDMFDAHSLDRLDGILNKQYDGGMKLIVEKRFTYKVEESTEFAILLIWAEYNSGFKNVEALDGLGKLLQRLF